MECNPISNYPDSIDPLIFFQDNSLDKLETMEIYNGLIAQGKYGEANEYGCSHEVYGYFADYLNAIENRVYNLQAHLLTIEPKQLFIESETEPTVIDEEKIWV